MIRYFSSLIIFLSISCFVIAGDSLKVTWPLSGIVYQRDLSNRATIIIQGERHAASSIIKARLVARSTSLGTTTGWLQLGSSDAAGRFSGHITAQAGWYDLEICAIRKRKKVAETVVKGIGIGDVFVVVGHSVAQGGEINIEGSSDERVRIVAANNKSDDFNLHYLQTGDAQFLPQPRFVQATTGIAPAPFGHNTYFWSKFGEYVVKQTNLPVLIYNAAFGGTSLEHWAKSSQNIQFEHGFVKSAIRMPYINLHNTLIKYIPLTGIRAILADQGQNDNQQKSIDTIFSNYKTFMRQARTDLHFEELTVVVNLQTPSNAPQVRAAQERMLKEPNSFRGPDYDSGLLAEDRYDGIHLSESGLRKAAVLWAASLTPEFFSTVKPWLPSVK